MKFHVSQRAHVSSRTWSPMTTQNDARNMTTLPSPQFMFTVYEHVSKPLCDKLDLILAEMKKQTSMCEQTAIVEVGQKRRDNRIRIRPQSEHEPEPEQVYDMVTDDEEEQQQEAKSAETFATETLATLRTYSSDERASSLQSSSLNSPWQNAAWFGTESPRDHRRRSRQRNFAEVREYGSRIRNITMYG